MIKDTADRQYERMPRKALLPFQGDLKELKVDEYENLKTSLMAQGFFEPVEYWEDEKGQRWIIDGHQRLFVCDNEGWQIDQIPVRPLSADSRTEAARRLLLLNNKFGRITGDGLYAFLHDFNIDVADLDNFSFSDIDLDAFRAEFYEDRQIETPEDVTPELIADPITKPGDLWVLGNHRVICGDSTHADIVDKLFDGAAPKLMITDPPYGVEYDANWRNDAADKGFIDHAARRIGKVENDSRIDWAEAWSLFTGDVAYVWHAGRFASKVQESLEKNNLLIRAQIIWAKPRFAISRGHYHWQHEPCWYAVRKGREAAWQGDRSQTTLWEISLDENVEGGHSTQKPLLCMERAIKNHKGDVYDPFLGSGTTLIAAEIHERVCYGVELSPNYVDVIIKRWQNYTGQDAVLSTTGETFNQVSLK